MCCPKPSRGSRKPTPGSRTEQLTRPDATVAVERRPATARINNLTNLFVAHPVLDVNSTRVCDSEPSVEWSPPRSARLRAPGQTSARQPEWTSSGSAGRHDCCLTEEQPRARRRWIARWRLGRNATLGIDSAMLTELRPRGRRVSSPHRPRRPDRLEGAGCFGRNPSCHVPNNRGVATGQRQCLPAAAVLARPLLRGRTARSLRSTEEQARRLSGSRNGLRSRGARCAPTGPAPSVTAALPDRPPGPPRLRMSLEVDRALPAGGGDERGGNARRHGCPDVPR
jgi:hypothetical protein